MASAPPADNQLLQNPPAGEEGSEAVGISKKQAKKEAMKAEKLRKKQEAATATNASAQIESLELDPHAGDYGDIPVEELQSKAVSGREWTAIGSLNSELVDRTVLLRGNAQTIRPVSKKMAFLVVRQSMSTVQCVLTVGKDYGSPQMVKFATSLSRESIVDIEGIVSIPMDPIKGATQQVEIQVRKLYCVNRAVSNLPINIEDAARSEREFEKAEATGEQLVRVGQDTRLNYRVLDLRTPANQATFRVQCYVEDIFRRFLRSENFVGIHSPKLIAGSSEGGAAVFKLDYKGQPACLAQSPQLHKQMAICGGFERVFEVGSVFRAEDSYTHRHLCEFVGLDVEMVIKEHYEEVMDVVDRLFVAMFDYLNENCKKELEAIDGQYPFEPLKYLQKTLRLTFKEGVEMLKEAGLEVDPLGDLNTETERKLGRLVFDKYGTEFYVLHRYPLAVRPFYTMPCADDPAYSNSFDVFIRGEEIISGAQRVHVPELLTSRAEACGIDVKTISSYIDSFRYGAPPHGGFGVGLERVVMLFCALNNIRKTSLFPRDPQRLAP
ncbi:putative aspartate--tRNA ligase [Dioscorea sansibarensis]